MKAQMMDISQIRKEGLEALAKALGPVGMTRFLQQFETGMGNYTIDRKEWLGEMSVLDIVKGIKAMK